jgi:hypothetical protein
MTRADDGHPHDPEAMDYLAMMSFASVEAFGAYLASEEYGEMVGKGKGDGGVKSSFVLSTELKLPPRSRKLTSLGRSMEVLISLMERIDLDDVVEG